MIQFPLIQILLPHGRAGPLLLRPFYSGVTCRQNRPYPDPLHLTQLQKTGLDKSTLTETVWKNQILDRSRPYPLAGQD